MRNFCTKYVKTQFTLRHAGTDDVLGYKEGVRGSDTKNGRRKQKLINLDRYFAIFVLRTIKTQKILISQNISGCQRKDEIKW